MPYLVVVEGPTDEAFYNSLVHRLYGSILEVEFDKDAQSKYDVRNIVKAHLRSGVRELAVIKDIDAGTPQQVLQSIQDVTHSALRLEAGRSLPQHWTIRVEGRVIHVIAAGLYQDPQLMELGITSHSLEDYILKLLLEDPGLRENAPELGTFLPRILEEIREHEGPFTKSKELF